MKILSSTKKNRTAALLLFAVLCSQLFVGCNTQKMTEQTDSLLSSTPSAPTESSAPATEATLLTDPSVPEMTGTAPTPSETEIPSTAPTAASEAETAPAVPEDGDQAEKKHVFGDWVTTKKASCTASGSKSRRCTICGYEDVVSIARTGHNLIAGICSVCGYSKTSSGITYFSFGDGTCSVQDLSECYDEDVVIPSRSPDGDVVVELDACLIDNVSTPYHRSITIPATVTRIEPGAFRRGDDLEHLYVHPDNSVFYSVHDCIIEKATGTLVAGTKNCVVPTDGSVKIIGADCFEGIRTLKSFTIPASVHTIGNSAFFNTGIVDIVIPDTVTTVEQYAFSANLSLRSVRVGKGVTVLRDTFTECPALKSVTLSEGITTLDAFDGCTALEIIDIPDSVVELGGFDGCTNLKKITIPDGVQVLCDSAFAGCSSLVSVIIPDGVEVLPEMAFKGCFKLKSVTIPDSVTVFEGWSIFNGCSSLQSIHIPEGVEKLDKYVFTGCSKLEHVVLPNSMISLGDAAFAGCSSMKTLTIGNRLAYISSDAFAGCVAMENIYASDPENMIIRVEGNCLIDGGHVVLGSANSVIPDDGSITSISWDAFQGNQKLTHIEIPSSVRVIHQNTFSKCTNLRSVILSEGLEIICNYAFNGCTGLTEIEIPSTVTLIEEYAFYGCTNLESPQILQ